MEKEVANKLNPPHIASKNTTSKRRNVFVTKTVGESNIERSAFKSYHVLCVVKGWILSNVYYILESYVYVDRFTIMQRSMRDLTEDWHFLTAKTTLGCSRPNHILEISVIVLCLLTLNNINQVSRFSTPFGAQKGLITASKLPIA
ncbi:hypothetical protein LXL04_031324 [Taraxacum kok-saghyz]